MKKIKFVTLAEFKKKNESFYSRKLREKQGLFLGVMHTEKKFTTVERIGQTCTEYSYLVWDSKPSQTILKGKKLARMLREGKVVIHKGQDGFKENLGIKNVFSRYDKMISKLERGEILSEEQMEAFFTRLYDFADYNMGIYLN